MTYYYKKMKHLFPFFQKFSDLHYFDSGATTLKPKSVIDRINLGYERYTLAIGKSLYKEAERGYEEVVVSIKKKIQILFHAFEYEVLLGHSVTIFMYQIVEFLIENILIDRLEIRVLMPETVHNSFFKSIQKYKQIQIYFYSSDNLRDIVLKNSFDIIYVPIIDHITGNEYDLECLELNKKNAIIIGDASQSAMYQSTNLMNLLFDFYLLAGHKLYGPEGTAVLLVAKDSINRKKNKFNIITLFELKEYFSQGSISHVGFYALLNAFEFLEFYIYSNIEYKKKQKDNLNIIYSQLESNKNIVLVSPSNTKTIISFYHKSLHAHDIVQILSQNDICCRSGDLCSPFEVRGNKNSLVRVSFGCYVNHEDKDALLMSLLVI